MAKTDTVAMAPLQVLPFLILITVQTIAYGVALVLFYDMLQMTPKPIKHG
jgi:ABC-type glucose/galactose transport system permease subunit